MTRAEMLPGVGRDITAFMNTVQALEKGTWGNFPFIKVLASGNSMSLHKVAHMRKRKIDETFRDYDSLHLVMYTASKVGME